MQLIINGGQNEAYVIDTQIGSILRYDLKKFRWFVHTPPYGINGADNIPRADKMTGGKGIIE